MVGQTSRTKSQGGPNVAEETQNTLTIKQGTTSRGKERREKESKSPKSSVGQGETKVVLHAKGRLMSPGQEKTGKRKIQLQYPFKYAWQLLEYKKTGTVSNNFKSSRTSQRQQLEVRIAMGCCISPIVLWQPSKSSSLEHGGLLEG